MLMSAATNDCFGSMLFKQTGTQLSKNICTVSLLIPWDDILSGMEHTEQRKELLNR